ncbi:hypothetical protein niasHT_032645 [Heterodera trifolii]|uniref:Uncharacterized protein n=1 Tax=Heterodera trifolii TaxID=157864 RepID=A0ABD2J5T5_9BILA
MIHQLFCIAHLLLLIVTVTDSRDTKDLFTYIGNKYKIASCRKPAKCRSTCEAGAMHMCVFKNGFKAEDIKGCCADGYDIECCVKPLPKEIALHERCKYEESNCLCGWGACIKRQGWAAGGCCDEGFEFRCCQSTDLVKYMQAKDECKDKEQMCLCGFEKVNHYIMGMCCDDGSCLCCRKVLLPTKNVIDCQKDLPCNNTGYGQNCVDMFSCNAYCVWNEGFKESPCCKENYTAICWNYAPRPAKMFLSTAQCFEKPEIRISMEVLLNFNKETDSYCASHAYMMPDSFLHTIKELAGEVVEAGSVRVAVTPQTAILLSFLMVASLLYVMGSG